MKKIIKYYRLRNYGTEAAYIHPDNDAERNIIRALTGKQTVSSVNRELIRDLTGGMVTFEEVVAP